MREKLFVSYSHIDAEWLKRIREQLTVLERTGLLEAFDDMQIGVGQDWHSRLNTEMSEARVALLLVSAPFLGSAFILRDEVPRLLERHEADGMVLYPLLVRDCPWQLVPWLARLQMRPTGARPVAGRRRADVDKCLADVAREIASLLNAATSLAKTTASRNPKAQSAQKATSKTPYLIYKFSGDDKALQQTRVDLVRNIEKILNSDLNDHSIAAVNALIISQHNGAWQYHITPSKVEAHLKEAEAMYTYLLGIATQLKPTKATADIIFALGRMKDSMLHRIKTLRTKQ